MTPDEHDLPVLDDPFRVYERWRALHPAMEAQAAVASFLVELLRSGPSPGQGERVLTALEDGEPLEVRIVWMFDRSFAEGRGLLRLAMVESPGDPGPWSG